MWQHNIWCVYVRSVWRGIAVQHTSPHKRTQTHQMLCCRITTLIFYISNKF